MFLLMVERLIPVSSGAFLEEANLAMGLFMLDDQDSCHYACHWHIDYDEENLDQTREMGRLPQIRH